MNSMAGKEGDKVLICIAEHSDRYCWMKCMVSAAELRQIISMSMARMVLIMKMYFRSSWIHYLRKCHLPMSDFVWESTKKSTKSLQLRTGLIEQRQLVTASEATTADI